MSNEIEITGLLSSAGDRMMEDKAKTKAQLIQELASLRQQLYGSKANQLEPGQVIGDLIKEKEVLQRYLNNAEVIIMAINKDHTIEFINNKGCKLLNYSSGEIKGKNFFTVLIPGKIRYKLRNRFDQLMAGRLELIGKQNEMAVLTKNGDEITMTWHITIVTDEHENITGAVISGDDISEYKRIEATLRDLTFIDELTGLYNRRGFLTLARQHMNISNRTQKEILLLFADIDGMKKINDTLGHQQGDKALIDTANILKKTFRESDIIARIGGDEFVVLAMGKEDNDATVLQERLNKNLQLHNTHEDRPYCLSISMGVTTYQSPNAYTVNVLMSHADKLMYEHKKTRKTVTRDTDPERHGKKADR
ncbi:MAG: GGDEF domain-containing protein [Dehalococcoidia bacterium]